MSNLSNLIPKTSAPLAKFVRTAEGWLVIGFNVVVGAAAIFGNLPGTQAVKWGGIVTGAAVFARSGLKAIASFSQASGLKPIEPGGVPTELEGLPADDTSSIAVMTDKPHSGVKPDEGVVAPDPDASPVGGSGTGPSPGASVPGAATSRRRAR